MGRRIPFKKFILGVLCLLIFLSSPHILADESLFSISEGFLQSFEEKQAKEQLAETHVELENKFFVWPNYLSIFHLDPIAHKYQPVQIGPLTYRLHDEGGGMTQTQKGQVLGKYTLLPTNYMNLVLYQKGEQSEDVFRMTQLPQPLSREVPSGQYTIEAQTEVTEGISVFYGYDTDILKKFDPLQVEEDSNFLTQNMGLKLDLLPGMVLNADYKKNLNGAGSFRDQKGLNVAYIPGAFASFTAGYGVISKDLDTLDSYIVPAWLSESISKEDQMAQNSTVVKQWGMAVYPSDYSQLSADYITTEGAGIESPVSRTVFGLRLGDQNKELNATYQMENLDNQKTTTSAGVEVGFVDLARLRAVYSKIEGHEEDNSKKSTLDLGINLNFARYSSLDLKYKWAVPEEFDPEKEQIAEAKLEIKF